MTPDRQRHYSKQHYLSGLCNGYVVPEDRNSKFLRTLDKLLPDYTALHPRRHYFPESFYVSAGSNLNFKEHTQASGFNRSMYPKRIT